MALKGGVFVGLRYSVSEGTALVVCICAAVAMYWLRLASPLEVFPAAAGLHLVLHLLLELVSVGVAVLVVAAAWRASSTSFPTTWFIWGFSVVALSDLTHALVYPGVPFLGSSAGPSLAVFLTLCARASELVIMSAIVFRFPVGKGRFLALAMAGATFLTIAGIGVAFFDGPDTLIYGSAGSTALKNSVDMALSASSMLFGVLLFSQSKRYFGTWSCLIGLACIVQGIGELSFINSRLPNDIAVLLGHMYKVTAYLIVLYIVYKVALDEPRSQSIKLNKELGSVSARFKSVLSSSPAAIVFIESDMKVSYANDTCLSEGDLFNVGDVVGRAFDECLSAGAASLIAAVHRVIQGDMVQDTAYVRGVGEHGAWWKKVIISRMEPAAEPVTSVAVMAFDITELEIKRTQVTELSRDMRDMRHALDAHAIVAITDRSGIIQSVNDKFCEISQYSREELLGRSHKVINSGVHDRIFFADLWRTISAGRVWNGDICNRRKNGDLYWVQTTIVPISELGGRPVRYISIRADITERKRAEAEVQRLAFRDDLTGLANRRLLLEQLEVVSSMPTEQCVGALLMLDLDHFKNVNDTQGHAYGDELLRSTASVLQNCVRASDLVCRLGGDEFAILLAGNWASIDDATVGLNALVQKIKQELWNASSVTDKAHRVTPSVGIAFWGAGSRRASAQDLLKQADLALYRAKELGRNQHCFFDPSLQEAADAHAEMLRDLRFALDEGQFFLLYQPIVDPLGTVRGVEALVRWAHPVKGTITPDKFIDAAEKAGLMQRLGGAVLLMACQQASQWREDSVKSAWTISVNVSAKQVESDSFVGTVMGCLQDFDLAPAVLRLELTESLMQADIASTIAKMRALQSEGVQISLDDFGTGYSSLSYLKMLPLNQLKIDKEFVRDLMHDTRSGAVAVAVLMLARGLELPVVAEGVESEDQLAFLAGEGCDFFQGYLFSRPQPPQNLEHSYPSACAVVPSALGVRP